MRHFQNPANGQIHGYDADGSQDELIKAAQAAGWPEVELASTGIGAEVGMAFDIIELEATITPRRLREAILTESGKKWLLQVETQIAALRKQLNSPASTT
jgi:hypothetical protein